jgi:hypothetical protein
LIADTALFRQFLEVSDGWLGYIDGDLLLEQLKYSPVSRHNSWCFKIEPS